MLCWRTVSLPSGGTEVRSLYVSPTNISSTCLNQYDALAAAVRLVVGLAAGKLACILQSLRDAVYAG